MEMTIVKPSRTRSMTMKSWSRGMSHSLIVVESPARDKGTATLKVDENLWNYLPKISRTVRIPPSMMLGSWMGSDMTNDDLVKEASYADDFDASWDGKSTSPAGWKLKLVAKPGKVGLWKRIEMIINDDATLPIQSKYYDRKDRLARTMYFEEVKELGGRKIPSVMRLVPEDKKGEYTVMKYLDIQFDVDVPESTFSLSRLKHGR
jgi:outer membrane lipoprotein-sorting protein